jgi:hypothetical protein
MKAVAWMPSPSTVAFEAVAQLGFLDVGDVDGSGIGITRAPGRVAGDRRTVVRREAARCDELHDAGVVEQQDGRAIAGERRLDGIHRGVVGFLQRARAMQLLAELVERVTLPVGGGDFAERCDGSAAELHRAWLPLRSRRSSHSFETFLPGRMTLFWNECISPIPTML